MEIHEASPTQATIPKPVIGQFFREFTIHLEASGAISRGTARQLEESGPPQNQSRRKIHKCKFLGV